MIQLAIINASSTPDDDVHDWTQAVQHAVTHDYYPAWGVNARLTFVPKGKAPPKGAWQGAVTDTSDQATALGWHDVTSEGLPLLKVFVETARANGALPSITLAHETFEVLGDPEVNRYVQDRDDPRLFWFYENSDAPESDQFGYDVTLPHGTKVRVSDFCLPRYFQPSLSGGHFDFTGHLTEPLPSLLPGGYMGYVKDGQFSQISRPRPDRPRERELWRVRPHDGSRRRKRMIPRAYWIRSTVETI